ncbi:MAG: efflux transporter periplasmic adaptor subunit [Sphingomonadales bacterium]|nr:efflux transporter periplasmic adaptor subunit [Sphingomonadales bacterium]
MKTLALLVSLALTSACGGTSEDTAAPDPVATVRTASATRGATSDELTVYGAAEAGSGAARALTTQAEAIVAQIIAPNGTAVRAGQTIAILRPSATTILDAIRANSDATTANAALSRAQRLRADGLVSDADVETARAAATAANATRASIGTRNGTLTLRATVSGTVQRLTAKTGDLIAAGTTVATIATGGDLRARFGVDPAVAQRVHSGQPIKLFTVNGTSTASTSVLGIDPQVDATTRLASIYARVPAGLGIGAGESLRARIALAQTVNGITIPYAALFDDGGRSYVYVVTGGVAKARDVSPGSSEGDRIRIVKGLAAGERVVTEGGTAVEDGMKVREDGAKAAK